MADLVLNASNNLVHVLPEETLNLGATNLVSATQFTKFQQRTQHLPPHGHITPLNACYRIRELTIGDRKKMVLRTILERRLDFCDKSLRCAFYEFGHLVGVEVAIIESLPKVCGCSLVHKDSAGLDA
jgi:hypothetical protein